MSALSHKEQCQSIHVDKTKKNIMNTSSFEAKKCHIVLEKGPSVIKKKKKKAGRQAQKKNINISVKLPCLSRTQ